MGSKSVYSDIIKKRYIDGFAHQFFGFLFTDEDKWTAISKKLTQARIQVPYDIYLSRITFLSVFSGLIGILLGGFFTIIFSDILLNIKLSFPIPFGGFISSQKLLIQGLFISVLLSIVFSGTTWSMLYYYPWYRAKERKWKIDTILPHAVVFMYGLSQGNMNMVEIIREMANSQDVYGEVSKEFDSILKDMEYFGNDFLIALKDASRRTPSSELSDFLDDLVGLMESGGKVSPFLLQKSRSYYDVKEQKQKNFLNTLSLLAESYVTIFVAGFVLLIIMISLISMMGGISSIYLAVIAYLVFPLSIFTFWIIVDIISFKGQEKTGNIQPKKEKEEKISEFEKNHAITNQAIDDNIEKDQDERIKKLNKIQRNKKVIKKIKNPIKEAKQKPYLSLILTIPLTLIFFIFIIYSGVGSLTIESFIEDPVLNTISIIIIPFLMVTLPMSFLHELKQRQKRKVIRELPDILNRLSSANETGMSLEKSIELVSETSTGLLSKELKKVNKQIKWGIEIDEALINMANRIKVPRLSRTIKLLIKSNKSSGYIKKILEVATKDTENSYKLDRQRLQDMSMYIIVILIGFLAFLFIIVIIETQFIGRIAQLTSTQQLQDTQGQLNSLQKIKNINPNTYKLIFLHSAIIQAIGGGLIAGKMATQNTLTGLKYSITMTIITIIIFSII